MPLLGKYKYMQASDMTADDGVVSPIDSGLDNGPGKLFAESRNKKGVVKYTKFSDKPLKWRAGDILPPETYLKTLSAKALQAQEGYVFHAEALRTLGIRVFRTGDYHIVTTLREKSDVVKFQTREFLPGGQKWTGPRDIAHLAFLSVENGELPVYHFWIDPTVFEKNPDRVTLAETIGAATSKEKTDEAAKQREDELKMHLMPNITPSDRLWIDKLADFEKLLANYGGDDRKQSLMDVMKETFLEDQIRCLAASGEHSQLSMLQGRDQLLYFDNIDNGTFRGVKNNTATKFCMVYFGLPVEPLTLTNILNANGNEDDARDKVEPDYSILPRIYGAQADLEFLDSYHERAYGYPALRKPRANRPYKDIPEEVSDLIREQQRIEMELYPRPTRICGGNYDSFYGMDSYDFEIYKPKNNRPSAENFLGLRGGAGPSQIPGNINDDDDVQPDGGVFNVMGDVVMDDVGLSEFFDGDCEETTFSLVPYLGDVDGFQSSSQDPSWINGFGRGLRGGASSPRSNEEGVEEQSRNPSQPPDVNNRSTTGTNTDNAAPAPLASLPPVPSMDSILASLQEDSRQPRSARRPRWAPGTNKSNFDPNQHRDYMAQTARALEQDNLRVSAYHKAQSVHEPHAAKPEPPKYGKSVEDQLVTGPTTPGVFANSISLAEIRQLQARNGELERLVLGRTTYCGMCDKSISFTTKGQRDAHFAGHLDGLHSCGFCGISFNLATQAERKSHLASHADTRYTNQATNTSWEITAKAEPPRPTPVNSGPRQAAQATGIDGDTILYCQNCGVTLTNFTTPAQLIEHTCACPRRNLPPSEPAHCKFCGIEIITLGSADDVTNHRSLCKGSVVGRDRQQELWSAAAASTNDDRELTYWKLCALTGIPDLHYKPRTPAPSPYECRYSSCNANLLQEAKDGTLDGHHKRHVSNGDRLRNICQANRCWDDLSGHENDGEERIQRHLTRHRTIECAFPGCDFSFTDEDVTPSTREIELEARKKWINHAYSHLDDDADEEGEDGHYFGDSDPPSDYDDYDGRHGTTSHTHQGGGGNTGIGIRGMGAGTHGTEGNTLAEPLDPKAPPPKAPGPKVLGTYTGTKSGGVPKYYMSIPEQWLQAIRKLPDMVYKGSTKKQKLAFICPVCYLSIQGSQLSWHRSVCPDGEKGCGVDNDNDLLIFSALSAGRVRNSRTLYDQVEMQKEGATTWGNTQKLPPVSQYLARHPVLADKGELALPNRRFKTITDKEERVGKGVRVQQKGSENTVKGKAQKRAAQRPKRGATTAPSGQRPTKVARGTGSGKLPSETRSQARGTPVTPAREKWQRGGLFVSSSPEP